MAVGERLRRVTADRAKGERSSPVAALIVAVAAAWAVARLVFKLLRR